MHYACPKCKKNIGIDGSGKYECPYCKESFSVSAEDFHKALKTSMSSPVKKRTFSIAYLWILSITGIFLSLFSFGPSFFAGLLILLSSLLIFPPIRKLYSKKFPFRLRYILIVSAALLFTAVWITPKEYNTTGTMAKTTQKVLPKEIDSSTDNPVFKIAYNCVKVKKITVNQKELIESEIEKFCNQQYTVKLKSGENLYSIVIVSRNSKIEESIKVVFDEEAYKIRLAEEQAKAKAEAAAREKAAAEAKAKAAEAKAKAEAELLKSRGTKYCSARKSYDNKYAPIISKNDKWKFDTTREKKGRYLTQTDCERIIKSLIKYSGSYLGGISDTELKSIISGKLWIGMDSFQFAISIGLPNDINTTTTAWNTNQQWVYYKDSYGISSYYAYFDDGKLTSTQDF